MHIHVPAEYERALRVSGRSGTDVHFRHAGHFVIFDVDGPLALPYVADELREEVHAMLDGGRRDLVLDLSDVPYADSAGIGALVAVRTLIMGAGGKLVLLSAPRRILDSLRRMHLERIFNFSDDSTLAFARP
ncbi:MAG TPA: STAS domain-containing protein [Terriglobia bacterium]|nr:STAS domain-containing protein [Terriglobia bacterium]